jgi:hypothetical protein
VVLNSGGELLFCAHHMRQHGESIRKVAMEIHDETDRLLSPKNRAGER